MAQATRRSLGDQLSPWLFGALLVLLSIFSGSMSGQTAERQPAQLGKASLLYHSQAGQEQPVPLVHTDDALDVRGLVTAATITQQYGLTVSAMSYPHLPGCHS